MAEKTKLVADFISAENVGPNERSEFALGLAVALLLQLSTIEQIQNALATIKGGYSWKLTAGCALNSLSS
jgi:hypothetical protein